MKELEYVTLTQSIAKDCPFELDQKTVLIMEHILEFFSIDSNYDIMIDLVFQKNKVSLRVLDWFVTRYTRAVNVVLGSVNVYHSYRQHMKCLGKKHYDPFCRKNKLLLVSKTPVEEHVNTSCGQLYFIKWCIETGVVDYVSTNYDHIFSEMHNTDTDSYKNTYMISRSISKHHQRTNITF